MIEQVYFRCDTCQQYNKQYLGTTGFELKETRTESLTDAMTHVIEGHYVLYFI